MNHPHHYEEALADSISDLLKKKLLATSAEAWTSAPAETAQDQPMKPPKTTVELRLHSAGCGELYLSLTCPDTTLRLLQATPSDRLTALWQSLVQAAHHDLSEILASYLGPISFTSVPADAPFEAHVLGQRRFQSPTGEHFDLTLAASSEMRASLSLRNGQASSRTAKGTLAAPQQAIERVIDVPLAVTLRFGQRHLTLREVLALATGSLVELDRQVEEPVELVLGDRLIARGEVVIVDGNYGLRVTEVIEGAAHRAETLHTAVLQQAQVGADIA